MAFIQFDMGTDRKCICMHMYLSKQMADTILLKPNAAAENVNLVMHGTLSLAGQLEIVF